MRLTRKKELDQAANVMNWERYKQVMRWSPGGWKKFHKHLRRARRMAAKHLHVLTRFVSGAQMCGEENGEAFIYTAECPRCKRFVVVSFVDSVEQQGNRDHPQIYGSALEKDCE